MVPLGEEEIDVTIVIRVAGADSLPPAEVADAALGDVLEAKAAEVVIKMRRKRGLELCRPVTLTREDIRKTVVIVSNSLRPRAGVFDDISLIQVAGDHRCGDPGLRGYVAEIGNGRLQCPGKRAPRLIGGISGKPFGKAPSFRSTAATIAARVTASEEDCGEPALIRFPAAELE